MTKPPAAPEAPADESPTPQQASFVDRRVSHIDGMLGRRYNSPAARLDFTIGAACEDLRLKRIRAMRDGTNTAVDETVKKK